jgi:hypothetical protein
VVGRGILAQSPEAVPSLPGGDGVLCALDGRTGEAIVTDICHA